MTAHTLVLTDNEGGLMTMRIECSAAPDAPCRRRPPDWMNRETWTDEEATETGHECWAVEWAAADPESIIYSGSTIRIPVDVVYDDGVEVIPIDPVSALPLTQAEQPGAEPTEAEWSEMVQAERERQRALGYTSERDAQGGVLRLLLLAQDHLRRGKRVEAAALIDAAGSLVTTGAAGPTEAEIEAGAHVLSEWLNDNAPIGEQRYREPFRRAWLTAWEVAGR